MLRTELKKLWIESPSLTATAILMLAAFAASVAGIFIDPRTITGMPAWLKPAKFAISVAIFSVTIAWLYRYVQIWPRFKRAAGWVLSFVLIAEVAIIDVQAARGTTSHFNVNTPADAAWFGIMGAMILILWITSAGIAVMLFKQPFADRPWGWALRLGMLISVIGSATGGMMLRPSPEQVATMRAQERITAIGGHTVGAPDGGPGLPGVGWSTQHGDLRIPHFLGLHAIQVVPFLGWLASRRRGSSRTIFVLAASYLTLVAILLWQALRGQSILEPDSATLWAGVVWLTASIAGLVWSVGHSLGRLEEPTRASSNGLA
jgi:hypothetical protein